MNNKPVQAIVFDLDGVLISSERPTFILLQEIVKKYGYALDDSLYQKRVGRKIKAFVSEVFKDVPVDIREKIIQEFYAVYTTNLEKYIAEIPATVNFIRNYNGTRKLGIASMTGRDNLIKILDKLGIRSKFSVIISSDDVQKPKPDPEIYLKAAELLGCQPFDCIAVEDSPVGAESGVGAGFQTYVFLNGINKKEDFKHLNVSAFIGSEKEISFFNK